jgi:hypothetical protein
MNIFKDIATLIKTEEGQKALPLVATAVTNLSTNPTLLNLQAQGGLFLAGLINAEVGIGQDVLKAIAADVTAISAAEAAPAATTAAPAAAPAAASPTAGKAGVSA